MSKIEELKTKFKDRHDGNLSRALWIAAVEFDFEKIIAVVEAAKDACRRYDGDDFIPYLRDAIEALEK